MRVLVVLLGSALTIAAQSPASARPEIENVVAFARLYGVVRYFYPSDAAAGLDWNRFAVHGATRVRSARGPSQLELALKELFEALGPGIVIDAELPPPRPPGAADSTLIAWRYRGPGISTIAKPGPYVGFRTNRPVELSIEDVPTADAHVDVELTRQLHARVPLALTDVQARTEPTSLASLRTALNAISLGPGASDPAVRLADVIVAWNVFRHFYPYWPEAETNWDARLRPHLAAAYDAASSREAHRAMLRALIADVRDGHALVVDSSRKSTGVLPVQLMVIGDQLVIRASADEQAPVGAVVLAIDGAAAMTQVDDEMMLSSGTTQWKQARALRELATCVNTTSVTLRLEGPTESDKSPFDKAQGSSERGRGARDVTLACKAPPVPTETRPDVIAEVESGIWYVDLTRASMEQVKPALEKLSQARGLIFDVRGYPTDAGGQILPYLVDAPETDRWMHMANITGPFGQISGWNSLGWQLKPAPPHLAGRRVFLTDNRAISYSESVMGYVADHKLATIIGGPTAGANGNVASFDVPGGFTIPFTGMRVTRHDGKSQHHLVGVQPDIPLEPTPAGVRAGRDELLERAIATLRNP
jgi:hypothetical protein